VDADDPLGFIVGEQGGMAKNVVDAAYRFCRDEPGMHVILSGTGNAGHLEDNLVSMGRPPLAPEARKRLMQMFEGIDNVSGQ
jgi:predicted aldo/keto reductase-like oxidoreductase